jgi:hypothetical protein
MKKWITIIAIGLLFMNGIRSCESGETNPLSEYAYVSYGSAFGECLGYCVKSIKITETRIDFNKSGWEIGGALPDISDTDDIDTDDWNELVEEIDFEDFTELDSIIGCPDCADGGAEWIEIKRNQETYKVTFEYGNEPETVKPYIETLRSHLQSFDGS